MCEVPIIILYTYIIVVSFLRNLVCPDLTAPENVCCVLLREYTTYICSKPLLTWCLYVTTCIHIWDIFILVDTRNKPEMVWHADRGQSLRVACQRGFFSLFMTAQGLQSNLPIIIVLHHAFQQFDSLYMEHCLIHKWSLLLQWRIRKLRKGQVPKYF